MKTPLLLQILLALALAVVLTGAAVNFKQDWRQIHSMLTEE
jgi:hypothetical protein